MDQRRRRVVRFIGIAGLGAIAGCSSSDTEAPNSTTSGTSDAGGTPDTDSRPPSDTPNTDTPGDSPSETATPTPPSENTPESTTYQEWLVAPDVFPDQDHYFFNLIDYEQIRSVQSELDEEVFSQFQSQVEMEDYAEFDLTLQDISEVIRLRPMIDPGLGGWNIIMGEFSKDAVTDAFTSSLDVSDSGETATTDGHDSGVATEQREKYTLYFGGELSGTVALADGVILIGANPELDSTATIRSLIDAKTGEMARYSTQNENMAVVSNELGNATFVGGRTFDGISETDIQSGLFEGQVGYGYADTLRGDILEAKEVFVFDERASVDLTVIEDEYTQIDIYDDFSNMSTSQDGRVVLVTGEVATADLYG